MFVMANNNDSLFIDIVLLQRAKYLCNHRLADVRAGRCWKKLSTLSDSRRPSPPAGLAETVAGKGMDRLLTLQKGSPMKGSSRP
jgi:hypothetical protein